MSEKDKKIKVYLEEKITDYDEILKSFNEEHGVEEQALRNVFNPYILSDAAETRSFEAKAKILVQVILLNQLYSTGLQQNPTSKKTKEKRKKGKKETISVNAMTDRIFDNAEKLEEYIKEGNHKAVEIIRDQNSKEYKDVYSFATKYCSFCNSEKYPMVDQYVIKMLKGCLGSGLFGEECYKSISDVRKGDLDKNYKAFVKVHKAFQEYIRKNVESKNLSCKFTDMFLWVCGKKYIE